MLEKAYAFWMLDRFTHPQFTVKLKKQHAYGLPFNKAVFSSFHGAGLPDEWAQLAW
ncbi:MAG: hypothetical protein O2931_13090 [Planctomycetota bacterium]|nr:hypothetical protein [Planctomycetota bacterium]